MQRGVLSAKPNIIRLSYERWSRLATHQVVQPLSQRRTGRNKNERARGNREKNNEIVGVSKRPRRRPAGPDEGHHIHESTRGKEAYSNDQSDTDCLGLTKFGPRWNRGWSVELWGDHDERRARTLTNLMSRQAFVIVQFWMALLVTGMDPTQSADDDGTREEALGEM